MQRMPLAEALSLFGLATHRDVQADSLKSKYRKLARQFHPDVNPGGAEMFAKVSMAHERLLLVLKDREADANEDLINDIFRRAQERAREREAKEQAKAEEPKSDRCHKETKSGPCGRPAGHAHGCQSYEGLRRKRENAKARRQANRQK